jgi:hypothetical protein
VELLSHRGFLDLEALLEFFIPCQNSDQFGAFIESPSRVILNFAAKAGARKDLQEET